MRTIVRLAFAGFVVGFASPAAAQELHVQGAANVMAGLEGGGSGYAAGVRRTRTTLRLGLDAHVDESPKHGLGVAALVEVEPRASFGADARYLLRFRETMLLQAGVTSILAPDYVLGATFGYAYRLPIGTGVELDVNPNVNIYFLGGDLPKDTAIWQGMLALGARIGLF